MYKFYFTLGWSDQFGNFIILTQIVELDELIHTLY